MNTSPSKAAPSFRRIGLQIGSVLLAVVLLVLALRGVDAGELKAALADASYWWVVPLVGIALASHVLRAWRWNVIIASMERETGRMPRLMESFGAVMVGYMVNYALPRLGEVARAGVVSRRTELSFAALIGTVAAERVLDVFTLSLALVTTAWLLRSQLGGFFESFASSGATAGLIAGFLVGGIGLAALMLLLLRRAIRTKPESRIARLSRSFLAGLSAILVSPKKWLLGLQTVAIWGCYWFMAYIPLRMLSITRVYSVGLREAWSVMNIGAIGVLLPSPGGLGSYHLITVESLTRLFGVHPSPAASYAVLTHGIQLVAYVISGVVALALFGMSIKGVMEGTSDEKSPDPGAA